MHAAIPIAIAAAGAGGNIMQQRQAKKQAERQRDQVRDYNEGIPRENFIRTLLGQPQVSERMEPTVPGVNYLTPLSSVAGAGYDAGVFGPTISQRRQAEASQALTEAIQAGGDPSAAIAAASRAGMSPTDIARISQVAQTTGSAPYAIPGPSMADALGMEWKNMSAEEQRRVMDLAGSREGYDLYKNSYRYRYGTRSSRSGSSMDRKIVDALTDPANEPYRDQLLAMMSPEARDAWLEAEGRELPREQPDRSEGRDKGEPDANKVVSDALRKTFGSLMGQ